MITLSSDFGTPYPAAMKGVILQQTQPRLVDITHELPRQDVRAGAFWLREILPYFPPAVHLVVVDPGVGTDRSAIAVVAGDHVFVAPDNGVVIPAAKGLADEIDVFEIDLGEPESSTFHGRDIFAPAAAIIHDQPDEDWQNDDRFSPCEEYIEVEFPVPDIGEDNARGEVVVVDGFGNAITNIPGKVLADHFGEAIRVNQVYAGVARSYGHAEPGARLVTVGSHGNVELAVNRGRGDEAFGVDTGSRVRLNW